MSAIKLYLMIKVSQSNKEMDIKAAMKLHFYLNVT